MWKKALWILTLQVAVVGAAQASDYAIFQKRYVKMGFQDPKKGFEAALVRDDQAWQSDCRLADECYPDLMYGQKISKDAKALQRIQRLVDKIVPVTHRPGLKIEVVLIELDLVNAETCGGDILYVYTGCLTAFPDDQNLAFVLAHEISHMMARHAQRKLDLLNRIAVLPTLSKAEAQLLDELTSRIFESEADALAINYLRKAGYRTDAYTQVVDLFNRMEPFAVTQMRQRIPTVEKEIARLQASCAEINKQFKVNESEETYLRLVMEYEKLDDAMRTLDQLNRGILGISILVVRTHPEPMKRKATCRAMEQGPTSAEPVAQYVAKALAPSRG